MRDTHWRRSMVIDRANASRIGRRGGDKERNQGRTKDEEESKGVKWEEEQKI